MSDLFTDSEVGYEHSLIESRRFGVSVGRLTVPFATGPDLALAEVREILAATPDDVVIVRYPSVRTAWFAELLAHRARPIACRLDGLLRARAHGSRF